MLNLRNTIWSSLSLLAMLLLWKATWWWYICLFLAASFLLIWGSYSISSQFYMHVVCKANAKKKQIAISFDDGPFPPMTGLVLDLLKEYQVSTVFFCIGKRIAGNENLLLRMHEEGHIVGNHSYSHDFWFDLYSYNNMHADLARTSSEVEKILQKRPNLFRPPYGVTNPNLAKAVANLKLEAIGWSVRSFDTKATHKNRLHKKLVDSLEPGAVYLFHDTKQITLDVLPQFIHSAKELGYEFVRPDILLNKKPYA